MMDFSGPQDFWNEQEREHRAHGRNLIVWGVVIAILVVLGLTVHTAFFGFAGLVSVGALFSLALWWTTRRKQVPDYRQPDSVEVGLDDESAPGDESEDRR
jgi:hypothetical protein